MSSARAASTAVRPTTTAAAAAAVAAAVVQFDRQNLVQLNHIRLEAKPRPGHVQAPHLGGGKPDLGDRLVPVLDEVGAPVPQRHRVVLPQVLLVHHLQADVLGLGDDATRAGELAVGEHIAVDETARCGAGPVVGPGDAVIEQQCAGAHLGLQEPEVRRVVLHADVLGQADRGHRVEPRLGDVAVVAVADLGEIGQPFVGDRLLRPRRLLGRQRDADGLDAVTGGVAHHAAPAAAHVEQPIARLQAQLLEHQPVLVVLRLLQRRVGLRIAGAGVGHRRAEHPFVERVRHVVVVMDGLRRHGFCCAASPSAMRRQRGSASCGGGAIGFRCSMPIERTMLASTRAGGRLKSIFSASALSNS